MITQNELKRLLEYNPVTGIFTWICIPHYNARISIGDIAGYVDNNGYRTIAISTRRYKAHRLAWLYMTGSFPNRQLDHINGIRDDNRWCNLREALPIENSQNRKVSKNNKANHLGVFYRAKYNKWVAYITINEKTKWLGSYNTKEEAIEARLKAQNELWWFQPKPRE